MKKHKCFLPGCSTHVYKKSNGSNVCAIYAGGNNQTNAEEECTKLGAALPEIYSEEDNQNIQALNVSTVLLL